MISIVMPTHKNVIRMETTLVSVFTQTYTDWELIVVDASDEKYFENYLDEQLEKSEIFKVIGISSSIKNKIKIIKPKFNTLFPGNMYMEGFNNTSCTENEFVIFLDHDDFLANFLLENVCDISYKYPDVEMISSDYISPLFDGNKLCQNISQFDNVESIAEQSEIWINKIYYKLPEGFSQYRNFHNFKANLHPKIIRKKAILDNRYKIFTNTEVKSDASFRIQSVVLKEAYILDVGYYWVRDYKADNVTSEYLHKKQRYPSKFALESENLLKDFEKYLNNINFRKDRIYYTPKNRNYIV